MDTSLKKELTSKGPSGKDRSVGILLVEDNPGDAVIIREMLNSSALDFTLERAATLKEAILLLTDKEYDIILLDLGLPDSIGLDSLKKIQEFNLKATVIVLTGLDDEEAAIEALKEGAQDYLLKNRLISDYFIRGIKYGIERKKMEHDLKSSEASYRKLSEELDVKVRDRTRDLEQSNYRLKLELIERHQAEDALRKSETRLKELIKAKDTLFSIIAHDLKNPFTCLLGSTEILLSQIGGMTSHEIQELAQVLNDSAKSGYSILQNLLDWSRSQTGMIVLHPENIHLKSIIEENISDLKYSSDQKEIEVTTDVQEDLDIITDKNLLNAILRNLLNNAVKFTHNSGKVSITATRANNEVTVSVKDTGIGIPESEIDELFGIENGHTRPGTNMEQGTGLGLKICREFVEMLGGMIWAESIDNEGSNFTFTLPVK